MNGASKSESSHRHFLLKDRRTLSYAEYGDPTGRAIILCHGLPGSRLEHPLDLSQLHQQKIHLIIPDRPGCGASSQLPGRTIVDYAADISQLADHLQLARFTMAGFSGGGPYAIACTVQLKDRVSELLLFSSSAPHDVAEVSACISPRVKPLFELAAADPQALAGQLSSLAETPEALYQMMASTVADCDKALFAEQDFHQLYLQSLAESLRQGVEGIAWDMHLAAQPWGIDLGAVSTPCQLWHGVQDQNAPIAMGRYLASQLTRCHPHFLPDEGHYLVFRRWQWIATLL